MTLGTMAVDHELRIDYDKLRKDRLAKSRAQMEKDGLGALLLFDPDNVRYVTSTRLGEWTDNKLNRYTLLAKDHEFAMELAEYNINVNSVNPSYVDTDIFKSVCVDRGKLEGKTPDEYRKELFRTVPMRRAGTTEEIGELCAILCDDRIGFLTGENVLISGGKVMRM